MTYSGDYCEQRPRRNPRESDDNYERRSNEWHVGCQHSIANGLTADDRSRCVEDLRRGHGDYWDKFVISAGPLGSFGWDIGRNHYQGFESACTQQTNQQLLESNRQKVHDDIECRRQFGGH